MRLIGLMIVFLAILATVRNTLRHSAAARARRIVERGRNGGVL